MLGDCVGFLEVLLSYGPWKLVKMSSCSSKTLLCLNGSLGQLGSQRFWTFLGVYIFLVRECKRVVLGREHELEFCGVMKWEVWSDSSVRSNQLSVSKQTNYVKKSLWAWNMCEKVLESVAVKPRVMVTSNQTSYYAVPRLNIYGTLLC